MKKPSLVLLITIAIGFGAIMYFQEQRAAELERVAASLHAGSAELTAQTDRNRDEIRDLRKQLEVFKAESEKLRAQLASAKGAGASAPSTRADTARMDGEKSGSGSTMMSGLAKMFTDPEMKKSMRVQQLVGVRMIYGDLAKELGLSPEDSQQFMEILADRQMDLSAAAMAKFGPDGADKDASTQKVTDAQKRYAEQLQAMLGEERYKKFQTYEGSIGDRFLLQQFEGQFSASGAPLEAAQKERLLGFMREERTKTPSNLMNTTDPAKQMDALKSDEAIGQFMTGQEDFNRRVLSRARDILSADQIAAFEKIQLQQIELLKTQMKMSRELLGVGK